MKTYFTIFADSSEEFTKSLNKMAKDKWELHKFQYVEYVQNIKDEGKVIIQSYVGILAKDVD